MSSSSLLHGQNLDWVNSLGASLDDAGKSIAIDDRGNVYTTGYFFGIVDFDPGSGVYNLTSNGLLDIFVQKLDAQGNLVWAKNMGGSEDDEGLSVVVDDVGSVYVAGYYQGQSDFDPNQGTEIRTSNGLADIFIQKLDSSGNLIWVNTMGSLGDEKPNRIILNPQGGIYFVGSFENSMDFDPSIDTFNLLASLGSTFIQKLTPQGELVWAKNFGNGSGSYAVSTALDKWGNIYTNGGFLGTADFDPDTVSTFFLSATGSGLDNFIQKLDSSGNFIWAKSFGGSSFDFVNDIAVDDNGNVYSIGNFNDTIDFNPGVGVYDLITNGGSDVFIQKLDSLGDFVWAKSFGGVNADYGFTLCLDQQMNLYLSGVYSSIVDFDPNLGITNLTASGSLDIFIQKLDVNGNLIWVRGIGGNAVAAPNQIKTDTMGALYLTGLFTSTVDFDPNQGTNYITSAGVQDAFLLKIGTSIPSSIFSIKKPNIYLYPNPTMDELYISREVNEVSHIRIIDKLGRMVHTQLIQNSLETINLKKLPVGIYFLSLSNGKEFITKKIIKE